MSVDCLPIVDARGGGFALIRSLALPMGVCWVGSAGELDDLPAPLVMLAVYSGDDLDRAHALLRRTPTLVIGVGTGPREASRAIQLGAVGYAHDDLAPTAIRDAIGESLVRARYRSLRAS